MQLDIMGILGIVIGVIVSYYFYLISLRKKEPCWKIRGNNVIEGYSDKIDGLKVSFQDELIENLTISKILFWNNGAETIDRHDIETVNALRIATIKNIKILDAKVLSANSPSSQLGVRISEIENCAYIDFDYLDNQQGAVIQIVHTGTSSKDLEVTGDIKGVKAIQNKSTRPKWIQWIKDLESRIKLPRKFSFVFTMVAGFIYVALGVVKTFWPAFLQSSKTVSLLPNSRIEHLSMLLILYVGGFFMITVAVYRLKNIKPPKGLEIFVMD